MLSALRTSARKAPALARLGVRNFGHDPAHAAAETDKWKKISYVAIPCVVGYTCFVMATMKHGHHEEVAYQYIGIRNKPLPWTNRGGSKCDLFDYKCAAKEKAAAAAE
mmetsp:Transcript_27065/g.80817  ORF Transcript_27065/g.80817 Transcript_27065/m.80817 type:complete len:108 (-) Transcript_27065:163-486(-)